MGIRAFRAKLKVQPCVGRTRATENVRLHGAEAVHTAQNCTVCGWDAQNAGEALVRISTFSTNLRPRGSVIFRISEKDLNNNGYITP